MAMLNNQRVVAIERISTRFIPMIWEKQHWSWLMADLVSKFHHFWPSLGRSHHLGMPQCLASSDHFCWLYLKLCFGSRILNNFHVHFSEVHG